MTCESYRILASACRDGELETGEIIELGDHLKNCGECRTLFDNYTGIDDQLAELSVPTEDLKKETELARTDLLKHYRAARPRTSFIQRLVSRFTVPPPFAYATAAAII
ncbi:MAG: hypothetical protein QGH40_01375, partial [bacterium]|nr:hypothetical protein [bacterium]